MEQNFKNLSLRLKFVLNLLEISQTELANKINVKPQVIQYLCASQSQKSKFTAEIAEALNIDFTWLATGKGVVPNKLVQKNKNSIPVFTFEQIREWKIYKKEIDLSKIAKWIFIKEEKYQTEFAVIISDRAMAPRFDLNTIIIIEPSKSNFVSHNSFVLVYLFEEDLIIFRQLEIKNRIKSLIPINKNLHKEVKLKEKDLILGVCKEARWIV